MDLTLCREVLELARRLNFRETAEVLYISQPALSRHVAAVEHEAGVRLFERDATHVSLTDAGRAFADGMASVIASYDDVLRRVRRTGCDVAQPVRLAGPFAYGPTDDVVSEALRATGEHCSFTELGVRNPVVPVLAGDVDIAVGIRYPASSRGVCSHRVGMTSIGVAVAAGHRLAGCQGPVRLAELVGENVLTYPRDGYGDWYGLLERMCSRARVRLTPRPLPAGSILFPSSPGEVILGTTFPGYRRYINPTALVRPVAGFEDFLDICVFMRRDEARPHVRSLFEAIAAYDVG